MLNARVSNFVMTCNVADVRRSHKPTGPVRSTGMTMM
jgi:hypothetical protein